MPASKFATAELFQPILDQSEICVNVLDCGAGRGLASIQAQMGLADEWSPSEDVEVDEELVP
ncbi:hypothetical protein EAS61_37020 [Bradyrhizobium zhanjiangense]|uniref:Uncharacterized protein n=1 Tax=Bradyrhizobium zhanjiangense TaxID=1325107 RepID=A0A4Q0Q8C6_9BRAD|nr:hypothetical protein EAS61_37020 [Bradyrhizobium zhanjiangense]